ncbi:MAG: shikimate kinase [Flavobacteriales bacterium]|nr:shikimate kinase [Flavobacteriales bacterium]
MKLPFWEFEASCPIALVGLPFSGKSLWAQEIAREFNLPLLSTDEMIEQSEGLSIEDIFQKKGELYFRKIERKTLIDVLMNKDIFILDTGGGLPCFYDNMYLLNSKTLTVWLDEDIEEIARRSLNFSDRPLLKGVSMDFEKRLEYFGNLRFERMPYYGEARWIRRRRRGNETWIYRGPES